MNAIVRVNAGRRLSPGGLAFLKAFEWCVPYPYDDALPPVNGKYREWTGGEVVGTLTIGYGHTNAAAHPLKIVPGLRLTEAEALAILDVDLDPCEAAVRRMVTVPLTQGGFDACVDFVFNCGEGNFANIARRLNAGDYAGARAALDLYVNPPRYRVGLQRRRDGEQALWDIPDAPPLAPATLPRLRPSIDAAPLPPRPEILAGDRAPVMVTPIETVPAPAPIEVPIALPTEPVFHPAEVEPAHGLDTSRTIKGAGAAAAAGVGITVDQAGELASQLQGAEYHISTGTVLGLIVGAIIVAGAAYALYARWDRGGRPVPAFFPPWLKRALA